jgi:predicted ribosomally synthesized peptide with SipW-like signal peptide
MSAHRSSSTPRRRPRRRGRSGRVRALMSLGAVAALSTGLSVQGTFAFWTDNATVTAGGFTAGTLDLKVDSKLGGTGGTTAITTLTADKLLPGESIAATFPVENAGNTPLTYTLTGTGSGGLAVTNGLQYSLTFGAAADNTPSANGLRNGRCGGVQSTDTNTQVLNSTARTYATDRALAVGATDTVCVVVRLSSAAGNTLQGLVGNATFQFDAKQVGA